MLLRARERSEAPPLAIRLASPRAALTFLAIAFIACTSLYNLVIPVFEAPDEIWHYLYVRSLAEGRGIPREDRSQFFGQREAGQPPLYYAVAALLTSWAPRGDIRAIARENSAGSLGAPQTDGNKNRFLHGLEESFPWQGEILTVHLVRLTTALWGLATILLAYLIGRDALGSRALGLAVAMVVTFNPEFLFLSAAVTNDISVAATYALLLWLAVRQAREDLSWRRSALLGGAAGLVILSKPIAVGGVGLVALALAVATWRQRRSFRALAGHALLALATTALVCGWWFGYNLITYHSPVPLQTFLGRGNLFNEIPKLSEVLNDFTGLKMSYWAVFGWFSILAPPAYYRYFDLLMLLAIAGWIGYTVRRGLAAGGRRDGVSWPSVGLVVVSVVIIVISLLAYRVIVEAFQGRLLFAAAAGFAVLLVFGWSKLFPPRLGSFVAGTLALSMVVPAVMIPWTVLVPAYAPPNTVNPSSIQPARRLDARLGPDVQLLGVDVSPGAARRPRPDDDLEVTLYLEGLHPMTKDYLLFIQLLDGNEKYLTGVDSHPGRGTLPTSSWQPGRVLVDHYRLRIPRSAPAPSVLHLEMGMYEHGSTQRLPAAGDAVAPGGTAIDLGEVILQGPLVPSDLRPIQTFDGKINLLAYHLDHQQARPGETIDGSLTYGDVAELPRDYTIFVQLIGPRGVLAQDDSQPLRGAYPTHDWRPGDLVQHPFQITLPPSAAPGAYRLITGWYDLKTGQRLRAPSGDAVDLGVIQVE